MLLALTTLSSGIFILQPKSTTVEEGESCDQGLSCSHRHQGGNHITLPARKGKKERSFRCSLQDLTER
ncbi:hypothetical protein Prudu_013935 [Prunus dulcis]|uniref:Uncharacterized protein n=1 Tax=Prunus dulcis TaxID=3755 RepID=A0A4Y1RGX3_PRUDU|nr:hypothetical protein Prudu_013935 [Prunus dulcis]